MTHLPCHSRYDVAVQELSADQSVAGLEQCAFIIEQDIVVIYSDKEEGRKEMFYLTMHSTHFISQLYGVGHVKDHSDS